MCARLLVHEKILGIMVLGLLLSGCVSGPSVSSYQHYINCGNNYEDIRQIASCGKQSRNSYLSASGYPASSDGNMYVQFMDSLAGQVNDGKLTNNEAKMVWVQRTQELVNGYRQAAAQEATASALRRQNSNKQMQKGMDMITGACTLGVNC
jgi:hypothetical protein